MVAPPSTGGNPTHNAAITKSAPMGRANGAIPSSAPPIIPYSARRAAPLDMNTVERRNPLTREPPPRNRPHGLVEAPTFTPTEEEFRDPMEYIKSIYDKASKYGICKIIPPTGWDPDFAIDLSVRLVVSKRELSGPRTCCQNDIFLSIQLTTHPEIPFPDPTPRTQLGRRR
jgi:[histone H3]-trimethyl-L-lysine4 demethylase